MDSLEGLKKKAVQAWAAWTERKEFVDYKFSGLLTKNERSYLFTHNLSIDDITVMLEKEECIDRGTVTIKGWLLYG